MRDLNRLHLNGLRALEAAGRLGTLQAAANELGVTAGAVSRAVNTNRWNSSSRPDAPIILPVWSAHRHRRGCIRPPLMMVENATACTSSASTTSITRLRVRATQKPPPSLSGSTKKGWSLRSGWRKTAGPQGRDTPD